MEDLIFIVFFGIVSILGLFVINKQLKEENRRFAKQEHLYDLLIDKLEYELSELEIDNKK